MKRSTHHNVQELMELIKLQCRAIGMTQAQLAQRVHVSLPTLKRWLAGKALTLENLFILLNALNITLDEIVELLPKVREKSFYYTTKQEEFFSQKPEFLSYFDSLLSGLQPKKIEKLHHLTPRSTRRFLRELENLGLIEVHAHDKVKLLVQGEPVWRENGKLAKKLRKNAIDEFIKEVSNNRSFLSFFLHDYSPEIIKDIQSEINQIIHKAKSAHKHTQFLKSEGRPYGLMIGFAPFKWSLLKSIKEL